MANVKLLPPVIVDPYTWDVLEKLIKKSFIKLLYSPLYRQLGIKPNDRIKNSIDDLIDGLDSGYITYSRGAFRGRFNAKTSRELRKLGAEWDPKTASFKMPKNLIPPELQEIIAVSAVRFDEKIDKINRRLREFSPEEFADNFNFGDYFDRTLWQVEKKFQDTTKGILVAPQLDDRRRKQIADEWENNIRLKIQGFTEEHIEELRQTIQAATFAGNRYENLIAGIQQSYGVTENKARFLARQETNLLLAKFKETRYTDSGVSEYRWTTVHMPKDRSPNQHTPGNVRYSHGVLDGKIFRFDNPPITTAPGEPVRRNNPGEDYNCRCTAVAIVRF